MYRRDRAVAIVGKSLNAYRTGEAPGPRIRQAGVMIHEVGISLKINYSRMIGPARAGPYPVQAFSGHDDAPVGPGTGRAGACGIADIFLSVRVVGRPYQVVQAIALVKPWTFTVAV